MDRCKVTDLNSDDVVSPPPPLGVDLNLRKPNAPLLDLGILSLDEGESGRLSLLLLSSNSSKTSSVNPSSFASIRDETRGVDGEDIMVSSSSSSSASFDRILRRADTIANDNKILYNYKIIGLVSLASLNHSIESC